MQETIVQRTLAILPMNGLPLPTFAAGKWKCIWGKESHPEADCWGTGVSKKNTKEFGV